MRTPADSASWLTTAQIERFHAGYSRGDGCWEWTGERNNQGYGRLSLQRDGRRVRLLTHRLAYSLATGEDITGRVVRHSCDNKLCNRPDHLTPGTQVDNMQDAKERGRLNVTGLLDWHVERAARGRARREAGEKECRACQVTKPLQAFRPESRNADGHVGTCLECMSKRLMPKKKSGPPYISTGIVRRRAS